MMKGLSYNNASLDSPIPPNTGAVMGIHAVPYTKIIRANHAAIFEAHKSRHISLKDTDGFAFPRDAEYSIKSTENHEWLFRSLLPIKALP